MKRTIITIILTLAFTAFAIQAVEQTAFKGTGVIESTTGGFKFPDGSVQLSAANPPCTAITYLPYVISTSGIYCFTGNLTTSITTGEAIIIDADNVTIDLNGWTLDGLAGGVTTLASGIRSTEKVNITIRNGTIQGFRDGIILYRPGLDDLGGHLVEEIRAVANTGSGIKLYGSDNTVRRNKVINTGDSSGDYPPSAILILGPRAHVLNNSVTNTRVSGSADSVAIQLWSADDSVVDGNRIGHVYSDTGTTVGIHIYSSNYVIAKRNTITSSPYGIYFESSTGKYMDNLTDDVTTAFSGGTDAGGNN